MSEKLNYGALSLIAHKRSKGKLSIQTRMPIENKYDLSIAYTPGVAEPCKEIHRNPSAAYDYTGKGNMVAVISDGSAVLGLGNIGGAASMPVMEGKCALFKRFAGVDAIPIVLNTQDTNEIIDTIHAISPSFGGINLEDIAAPKCFEVEQELKKRCDIPIMHDDQHGTAVVTLAGMINAMRITEREMQDIKVVINGTGAAGISIIKLLIQCGVKEVVMVDTKGIIYDGRDNLTTVKKEMAAITNSRKLKGTLSDAVKNADVFIGVSAPGVLTADMVKSMNTDPIIFAMANPVPEIMPDVAREAGAFIVATGRSDFPNQINNVLAFPGLFRGILDARARDFTRSMYIAAAEAIANEVATPSPQEIIPDPFKPEVPQAVASAVARVVKETGTSKNG